MTSYDTFNISLFSSDKLYHGYVSGSNHDHYLFTVTAATKLNAYLDTAQEWPGIQTHFNLVKISGDVHLDDLNSYTGDPGFTHMRDKLDPGTYRLEVYTDYSDISYDIHVSGEAVSVSSSPTGGGVNQPPTVVGVNHSVSVNESISASALFFSVNDRENEQIIKYAVQDMGAGGGYFTKNGVAQNSGVWIYADSTSELSYVGGGAAGSEKVAISASDTTGWSDNVYLVMTTTAATSVTSTQHKETTTDVLSIARLYQAALGRQPDQAGLTYYVNKFNAGTSVNDLSNGFLHSPEFTAKFGNVDTVSTTSYIKALYENVLGRSPGQSEVDYYVGAASSGESRDLMLQHFSASPENVTKTAALNGMHMNSDGTWWFT